MATAILNEGGGRRPYVKPSITTYEESEVAERLGPVMLSGSGTSLSELSGGTTSTRDNGTRPRR